MPFPFLRHCNCEARVHAVPTVHTRILGLSKGGKQDLESGDRRIQRQLKGSHRVGCQRITCMQATCA